MGRVALATMARSIEGTRTDAGFQSVAGSIEGTRTDHDFIFLVFRAVW